ncbi:MAG: hypothetical protein LBC31_08620 [Treponema sp.]|nr:hypothetical protein [Treponema sp.]
MIKIIKRILKLIVILIIIVIVIVMTMLFDTTHRSPIEVEGKLFWQETNGTLVITIDTNKEPNDYFVIMVYIWSDDMPEGVYGDDIYGTDCSTTYDENYLYISLDTNLIYYSDFKDPYEVSVLTSRSRFLGFGYTLEMYRP